MPSSARKKKLPPRRRPHELLVPLDRAGPEPHLGRRSLRTSLSFPSPAPLLALHSFPTRRSSDLLIARCLLRHVFVGKRESVHPKVGAQLGPTDLAVARSEEHTSELQSRPHLVCRLLLEKKNFPRGGVPMNSWYLWTAPVRNLTWVAAHFGHLFRFPHPPPSSPYTLSLHDALPICS